MRTFSQPLRFRYHALAVLCAAMLGSTIFAFVLTAAMAVMATTALPGSAGALRLR